MMNYVESFNPPSIESMLNDKFEGARDESSENEFEEANTFYRDWASFDTYSVSDLKEYIGDKIGQSDGVLRIYSRFNNNVLSCWIIIEKRDRKILETIYSIEDNIIERFFDCEFDFHTKYANGRDIDSIINGIAVQVFPTL